jgi:phosphoribosylglycinamide formyltransferase-1
MTPAPLGLVVLISGYGSNLQAILDAAGAGAMPVRVKAVVSNRPDARGLDRARRAGVPAISVETESGQTRAAYDAALQAAIEPHDPDLIALAGFMRILTPAFVNAWAGRMLNIHPSLLPRYRGLHTHRRALEAGDDWHGASIHYVTEELDGGPVVRQVRVPVRPGDDEARLAARVQREEHRIYPEVIGWVASGRLAWRSGRPWLDGRVMDGPVVSDAEKPAER